ncbi:MAG: PDZ domain-containing protein, partial [Myxococcales bacterium]|nr:PDZ domain-containing protein [Myxococcales bacterium]
GIEVGMRDGSLTVLRVIDDNPASKAGVKALDKIVQIEEESTVTMTLQEAVDRLRGEAGTTVTIYLRRDGEDHPLRKKITRAMITLESITGAVLPGTDPKGQPGSVGLIQMNQNFAQTTGKELREKLAEFEKAGVSGVILDMRNNPGGLLTAAVEVADAFLASGTIVSTVGNTSPREDLRAEDRYDFDNKPVVVLIDEGSASATEIVAGALRNLGRAVLVGRRSFGKGSVQVLHDRKVGEKELALKLTVAQYLTPGDISIQSVGVSPDLETIPVHVGEEHIAYHARKRFDLLREESLADHLVSDKADPSQKIAAGPLYFRDWSSIRSKEDLGKSASRTDQLERDDKGELTAKALLEDPELRLARDLVLWAPDSTRAGILAGIDGFVETEQRAEQQRIRESLAARGIDWAPGPKASGGVGPKLKLTLKTDRPGDAIPAGESGNLIATVENVGDAPAFQVRAMSDSDYGYFDERELFFGRVDPGQSHTYKLKLSVNEHELTRTDTIDFRVFEQHGAKVDPSSQTSIAISNKGLPRPQFAYGFQVLDDPALIDGVVGNGDGAMQVGERVRLRVHIQNTGEGEALAAWVNLRNLVGDAVFLHSGREELKVLKPGERRIVNLDVEVKKVPDSGAVDLELAVTDTKIGVALNEQLSFPLVASAKLFEGKGGVATKAAVDLYASPVGDPQVVARAEAGAKFKVIGRADGWHRVQLAKDRFAFVRDADIAPASGASLKTAKVTDVLAVTPPRITLSDPGTSTQADAIRIAGAAEDDQAVRDVFITVYNPSRDMFDHGQKVFYLASQDPNAGRLEFATDVPLKPGNNLIEIVAREGEKVFARKRMWILRTSGLAEARAGEGSFKSDGSLSVDRLGR